ncbi:hypothetical protein [Tabrizicola flagellatus]|uniref:hypothetical protein n=1 Tax=Tabrizicola flagellatus TaxID=2593021 RepID=UPI0011F0E3E8|nr:hypothetical protein [Tabrizicola flagellatus]
MRFAFAVVMASFFGAASAETPPTPIPDDLDPCWAFTEDATYVNHTIVMQLEHREVKMRVPIDYFEDRWDRKDGFRDTAQLFSVDIGTFEMVTRPDTKVRKKNGIRSLLLFLISDHIPMERLAPHAAEMFIPGGNPDRPLADYSRMDGPFGLEEIKSPSKEIKKEINKNIYIDFDETGQLKTVLNCNAPGTLMNPGCEQFFEAAGLDVSATYDLSELPNWRRVQDNVTRFLTCATSSNL